MLGLVFRHIKNFFGTLLVILRSFVNTSAINCLERLVSEMSREVFN